MLRDSILAGRFYDAAPSKLRQQIVADLVPQAQVFPHAVNAAVPENARIPWPCEPVAARVVLLPHAGHMYCGKVMGQTLARCTLPRRLILLCPNHTGQGAALAVWPQGAWRTPLGDVPVDTAMAQALVDCNGFSADTSAHAGEHSLEVILPYLQVHSPESLITPVRVSCGPGELIMAGMALAGVVSSFLQQGESVGLVISSDLNHYAPEAENHRLDALAIQLFLSMDPVALYNTIQQEGISMCGVSPAALALFAMKTLEQSVMLNPVARLAAYATSGDAACGDKASVVGYAGIIVS